MAEPRRSRQLAVPALHNSEEAEFTANQPLDFGGPVRRSIPVNPRLQMHSMSLFFIH
jgi:hypothetical protein